jgi:5-methyltetrahydrofolate--homocysteine methyltransferase
MPAAANPLADLIAEKGVLLADGATGTNLFQMGLMSGDAPELWNEEFPERIARLHQDFVDAGADIILTNTFGGTRQRLKLHHAQDRVHALNKRAAEIARAVADGEKAKNGRTVIVAGSVGPTGELFFPLGALTHEDAVNAYSEQMEGLKAGGADVAWIETMSAPEEIRAAAEAAIRVGLPYTFTGSFDTAGKTMMGLHPRAIHGVAEGLSEQPIAVGANCGVGASDMLSSLMDMHGAAPEKRVIVKGNCGIPQFQGEKIVYSGTPELMAEYVRLAVDGGATIIGGCCGTSAHHLSAMRKALDAHRMPEAPLTLEAIVARIGPLRNTTADEAGGGRTRERANRRSR